MFNNKFCITHQSGVMMSRKQKQKGFFKTIYQTIMESLYLGTYLSNYSSNYISVNAHEEKNKQRDYSSNPLFSGVIMQTLITIKTRQQF